MLALLALLPLIPTAVLLRERMVLLARDRTEAETAVRQVYQVALIRAIARLENQASDGQAPELVLERNLRQVFGERPVIEFLELTGPPPHSEDEVVAPIETASIQGWVRVSGLMSDELAEGLRGARVEVWRLPTILLLTTLSMAGACGWILLRSLRLEDLRSDVLSTFSHEIRTPLAGIRAITDSLETLPDNQSEKRNEYHQLLRRENSRLMRLVDNFLTINRLERGGSPLVKRPLLLSEVMREAAEVMRPISEDSKANLEVQLPDQTESEIVGSPDALLTILTNLIDNAMKHGSKNPKIRLSARETEDAVQISVEDDGPGIPLSERKKVFARFYQIDQRLSRQGEGCGLGLHISRSLAKAHSGSLEISDSDLGGAKITLTLPQ
ncbi:MAG: HAMP domain-containing sensor histidine kinase [Verrucomicrobiota bacterium]